nr:hypothetical protein [Tanacetum cinerariifolium]
MDKSDAWRSVTQDLELSAAKEAVKAIWNLQIKERMFEFKTRKPEESSSNWKPWHKDWDATTSNFQEDNVSNDDNKYRYNRKGFLEDDEARSNDSIFIVDLGWDDYCLQALKLNLFPQDRKYVSLFKKGDTTETADKRNSLRIEIKENIVVAVASGKDFEGFSIRLWLLKCYVTREWFTITRLICACKKKATGLQKGSDDDGLDLSEDDFFLSGSSSDEADADDELTDKSARDQASNASGNEAAASGMSSNERNRHTDASVSIIAVVPNAEQSGMHFIEQYLALNQTLELQRVNLEIELWTRKLKVKILKDKVLQKQAKEAHDSNKDLCAAVWCIVIIMITFYGLVITLAKFKDKHEFTKGHHGVAVSIVLLVVGGLSAAFILLIGY